MSVRSLGGQMHTPALATAHVGLPKTATTFLQKRFFGKLGIPLFSTQLPNSWPDGFRWIWPLNRYWLDDLYTEHSILERKAREARFLLRAEASRDEWLNQSKHFIDSQTEPLLFSAEGLSGFSLPMAEFIGRLLKDAGVQKLLVIFRNQRDWSLSLWKQLILSEDRFARFIPYQQLFASVEGEGVVDMNWCSLVRCYHDIFGEDCVLALPYEMMSKHPETFFARLCRFVDADVVSPDFNVRENESVQDLEYTGWRIDEHAFWMKLYGARKQLHYHGTQWVEKSRVLSRLFLKKMSILPESIATAHILKRYQESNRQLSNLIEIELAEYDYY